MNPSFKNFNSLFLKKKIVGTKYTVITNKLNANNPIGFKI